MPTHDDDDYDVGYGKPPKSTRFKKGRSGNPNGRPKEAKGFNASLKREMETLITVREGDRQIKISKAQAAAKRFVEKALKGDMAALKMLAFYDKELTDELASAAARAELSSAPETVDYDILRYFFSESPKDEDCAQAPEIDDAET